MDIYREVHGESVGIPKEMEEQKERVFRELEELREGAGRMDELFRNEELRVSFIWLSGWCWVLCTCVSCRL